MYIFLFFIYNMKMYIFLILFFYIYLSISALPPQTPNQAQRCNGQEDADGSAYLRIQLLFHIGTVCSC